MNIGILSKRKTMFTGKMKQFLVNNKGFNVKIYTLDNLSINNTLLSNDLYILKSKNIFFIYAGQYLKANKIPVIPDPETSFKQKNRIHSHLLMKRAGLSPPHVYLSTIETLKNELNDSNFPLILKPIMGSGSKGVKLINSFKDLYENNNKRILYLEKFIEGEHYNVYFIGDEICTLIKPPLSNEHVDMERISTPLDVKNSIEKWRKYLGRNGLFGHLDIVREESTNHLYVVDVGSFPEFSQWQLNNISPVEAICNLILKRFREFDNI
ncbi:MAG: RimK family alpha-L-glutamate ligase [Candidatus Hodarchaeota archaeon]